jgi:BirA family transcriptional regulator, biotin operon repressor / biotin---[acetyl-CoA-carboxylase] ligase
MQTGYIGKKSYYFEKLDSTNTKARELLASEPVTEGTLVWTTEQTAGRGYLSNSWESEKGKNIAASYILQPTFLKPEKQFWITRVLSLAARDIISNLLPGCDIKIKWPNDIYVGKKKIAGILVENAIQGNTIKSSIAGIGININQKYFVSDAPNPTSVIIESGTEQPLDYCFEQLSFHLEHWYHQLKMENYPPIEAEYTNSLFRLHVLAWYMADGKEFQATLTGTDSYGRLKLVTPQSETRVFDFKEVRFLPETNQAK